MIALKNPYSMKSIKEGSYTEDVEKFNFNIERSTIALHETMKNNALQEAQSIAYAMKIDNTLIF